MDSKITRKNFIKKIIFASGTLFIGTSISYFLFKKSDTADDILKEIKNEISGEIILDEILLQEYSTDFGKIIHSVPRLVVIPADDNDIIKILKIANMREVPVTIRGAGHSCFGQSQSNGGILIVNKFENKKLEFKEDRVCIPSGMTWSDVEKQLNCKNLTSTVLTDFLDLTVGGTVSVGGYGSTSFKYGSQAENIEKIGIITPEGEKRVLCKNDNSSLYNYGLSGLGQLGIITSVELKPVVLKKFTQLYYIVNKYLNGFIKSLNILFGEGNIYEIDHFSAYIRDDKFICVVGFSRSKLEEIDYKHRIRRLINNADSYYEKEKINYHTYQNESTSAWVNRFNSIYCLWEDYIFDIPQLKVFLSAYINDLINKHNHCSPYLIYLLGVKSNLQFSFSPSYSFENKILVSAGFYYMIKMGEYEKLNLVKNQMAEYSKRCIQLNGRPYLYGWHNLSKEDKFKIYGEDYSELIKLKKQYDPKNILNPGIWI